MKAQTVRVLDVVAIGPAMVAGGARLMPLVPLLGAFLMVSGVATVIYNGKNYLKEKELSSGNVGSDEFTVGPIKFDDKHQKVGPIKF